MSRGALFQIAEENRMSEFSKLSEDELICLPDIAHEAEWVEDLHFEDWSYDFNWLLGKYTEVLELDREQEKIYFEISQRGKEMYFQNSFNKFKEMVSSLTLEGFADSYISWKLHHNITGKYLEGALLHGVYSDFDDMIRRLKPNERYIIYAGSLMH